MKSSSGPSAARTLSFFSSTSPSRSRAAWCPIARSSRTAIARSTSTTSRSTTPPMRSKISNQDHPLSRLKPIATKPSNTMVVPTGPSNRLKPSAIKSPATPPGASGIGIFSEYSRCDSRPTHPRKKSANPNHRSQAKCGASASIGDARPRADNSRARILKTPRHNNAAISPTQIQVLAPNRYNNKSASQAPTRPPALWISRGGPELDQPGSARS